MLSLRLWINSKVQFTVLVGLIESLKVDLKRPVAQITDGRFYFAHALKFQLFLPVVFFFDKTNIMSLPTKTILVINSLFLFDYVRFPLIVRHTVVKNRKEEEEKGITSKLFSSSNPTTFILPSISPKLETAGCKQSSVVLMLHLVFYDKYEKSHQAQLKIPWSHLSPFY